MFWPVQGQPLRLGTGILLVLLCLLGTIMPVVPALASISNLYGLGAKAASMGGAFTAVADDFSAPYYNPAGLICQKEPLEFMNRGSFRIENGLQFAQPDLYIQEKNGPKQKDTSLDLFSAFTLGIVLEPFDLAGLLPRKCVSFGIAISSPVEYGFWWERQYPKDREFVFHHDYNQHLVVIPAFAIEPVRGLSVGLGLNVSVDSVSDTYGQIIVGLDELMPSEGFLLGAVEISPEANQLGQFAYIKAKIRTIVGLLYRTDNDRFRAGLTYREALFVEDSGQNDLLLKIRANQDAPGPELPLAIFFPSRFIRYYSPEELAGGVAVRPWPKVQVSVDVTWSRWSGYQPQITTPVSFQLITIEPDFHDTVVPRLGCEVELSPALTLRGGYNFQESPVPNHAGYVTFVDNDRHVFSFGLEYAFRGFRVQGYFQYQRAVTRDFHKYPGFGEDFSAGGQLFGFGGNVSAAF